MAATFAQQFAPPDVRIISAGDKLHQVVPIAVKVMRELQLDIPPMVEVLISDV
ncbi:MAG: hypothetical protein HQ568_09720 [Calditrichaeota bacterium]|nr:hypothetical protein [Calditrichota bacterium]